MGGNRTINSDFRLIVATRLDLAAEVAAGRFREDLYYRLNVIPIYLPPLRECTEEIPLLADYYLKHYATKYTKAFIGLTADQNRVLCRYTWPGNIRELKNILERAVLLSENNQLEFNLPLLPLWRKFRNATFALCSRKRAGRLPDRTVRPRSWA